MLAGEGSPPPQRLAGVSSLPISASFPQPRFHLGTGMLGGSLPKAVCPRPPGTERFLRAFFDPRQCLPFPPRPFWVGIPRFGSGGETFGSPCCFRDRVAGMDPFCRKGTGGAAGEKGPKHSTRSPKSLFDTREKRRPVAGGTQGRTRSLHACFAPEHPTQLGFLPAAGMVCRAGGAVFTVGPQLRLGVMKGTGGGGRRAATPALYLEKNLETLPTNLCERYQPTAEAAPSPEPCHPGQPPSCSLPACLFLENDSRKKLGCKPLPAQARSEAASPRSTSTHGSQGLGPPAPWVKASWRGSVLPVPARFTCSALKNKQTNKIVGHVL